MNRLISIIFFLFVGFIHAEKRMVEITFDELAQLQRLVEIGIDLDHHRTAV